MKTTKKTTKRRQRLPFVCNHCFMVALKRKYGKFEGKRIGWLECPACHRRY